MSVFKQFLRRERRIILRRLTRSFAIMQFGVVLMIALACSSPDNLTSTGIPDNDNPSPVTDTSNTSPTPSEDSTSSPPAKEEEEPDPPTVPPTTPPTTPPEVEPVAHECATTKAGWIFCDDFESDRLNKYYEVSNPGGSFTRTSGVGRNDSWAMHSRFSAGQTDAGSLKVAFGKTPSSYFRPVDAGTTKYREVYWRMYLKNEASWTGGGGDKLSRAQIIATSGWAQAMVAPIWSGTGANSNYLLLDPSRGTDEAGTLLSTKYNDFANHKYLGYVRGTLPMFEGSRVGKWYCIEARVRLNDAGQSNGVFEFWIDNQLQGSRTDLNWIGRFSDYGINVVFFENYWNAGSPKAQSRYMDNIVVSTTRIGCL